MRDPFVCSPGVEGPSCCCGRPGHDGLATSAVKSTYMDEYPMNQQSHLRSPNTRFGLLDDGIVSNRIDDTGKRFLQGRDLRAVHAREANQRHSKRRALSTDNSVQGARRMRRRLPGWESGGPMTDIVRGIQCPSRPPRQTRTSPGKGSVPLSRSCRTSARCDQ